MVSMSTYGVIHKIKVNDNMTEEQRAFITNWIARNGSIKDEKWFEYSEDYIDRLYFLDEESYQMKKFLKNQIGDMDSLSLDEKSLCDEALSICSCIDETCDIFLYATPYNWEAPE
jgi:hypothetical protein